MDLQQRAVGEAAAPAVPGQQPSAPTRMVQPLWWADVDTVLADFDACLSSGQHNARALRGSAVLQWRTRDQVRAIRTGLDLALLLLINR